MKKEDILVALEETGFDVSEDVIKNIPEKDFDLGGFSMNPPIRY